ncbi:MAG: choice-of-anchor J domain-containing protein [Ginsengibacter sp.]
MRKSILPKLLIIGSLAVLVFHSCKDDSYLAKIPPVPDQSFVEEFDSASAASARGWQFVNASDPKGGGVWQDGGSIPPFFKAYSNKGSNAGFIGADYTSTSAAAATISNWLISPPVVMQNGDKIIFYTRAYQLFDGVSDTTDFGNSLQVRINPLNDNANVGVGFDVGGFSLGLFGINPGLVFSSVVTPNPYAYPSQWTRFEVTVFGLNNPIKSRFAFRYFVTDGGSNGNGTGIGIDSVAFKSAGHQ